MLAETKRSHNLNGLGYSPQQNNSRSHTASTSKNNFQNHAYKNNSQFNKCHAPNRYYRYKANHAGINYSAMA